MKSSLTIGLLWHSLTSDNLGVGALTESQIAICNAASQRAGISLHFVIVGTPGSRTEHTFGNTVVQGNPVSIRQTIRGAAPYLDDLGRCDLVLDIGEGDSFTDIYGLYRFAFLFGSKVGLLRRGTPLVLSPQTIGPFKSPLTRFLAARVLRKCGHVFARDNLSAKYVEKMGIKGNTSEIIDVAFRLPFTRPEQKSDGLVHVGINVSGLLMSGGYTGANQFGLTVDYNGLIERLIEHWSRMPDHVIWLVPHVMADNIDKDNDMVAIGELVAKYPTCRVPARFTTPSQAKSFISGLAFMTGARMHACIAAISAGVPVVPFSYSRKFNGLFDTLEYPWYADGLVDSTDTAFEKIIAGEDQRASLQINAIQAKNIADGRLQNYEDYLTNYFATLAAK